LVIAIDHYRIVEKLDEGGSDIEPAEHRPCLRVSALLPKD